jgi:geranylgeranylglycerol-phosphate geranylgeranyltransferase
MSVLTSQNKRVERAQVSFARSQLILFQSRGKWGIVYALATVVGIFCVPGAIEAIVSENNALLLIQRLAPLPLISLFITTGMFLLNDLLDIELDRANGKKRPLPSGQVTKRQGWIFITWTNSAAVLLAAITMNPASMILIVPMLAIGIMYSAPKIALDDRFVVKTVVIALYYMLCAGLGITTVYGIDHVFSNPIIPIQAVLMLGSMRFISSVLNDSGDVEGDKAAGRHTIPIVIGRANTVKMGIMIATGVAAISWGLYAAGNIGIATVVVSSLFALFMTMRMRRALGNVNDQNFIRMQHKKLVALDLFLLAGLAVSAILV